MRNWKSGLAYKRLSGLMAGAMLLALCVTSGVSAQQRTASIEAGTAINVRTTESIKAKDSDGRIFSGVVDQDVLNRNRGVAIPRGSDVELLVKSTSNDEVALDLEAIVIRGQRYTIETEDGIVSGDRTDGIGANKRTGGYIGGGALIGAVIGAITGGGKGAGIGAGVGAAAGAGTQVLTRGRTVDVPVESLVTFRLQEPLRTGVPDRRITRNGIRYNQNYAQESPVNTPAYRAGMEAGRSDLDRNRPRNTRSSRWTGAQDRRDYEAGYNRSYQADNRADDRNSDRDRTRASVRIGTDKNITWQAPGEARVFVQVDNNPRQLFAAGQSGTQAAPWISTGHVYLFIVQDTNGNEIARDQRDLRRR